jgi:hypothetical protein
MTLSVASALFLPRRAAVLHSQNCLMGPRLQPGVQVSPVSG